MVVYLQDFFSVTQLIFNIIDLVVLIGIFVNLLVVDSSPKRLWVHVKLALGLLRGAVDRERRRPASIDIASTVQTQLFAHFNAICTFIYDAVKLGLHLGKFVYLW